MIEQEEYTKENALRIEIDASFHYIKSGLLILKKERNINYNRHITLQLLASGFERILKILLLLRHKYLNGMFPETEGKKNYFSAFGNGHAIEELLEALVKYSNEQESMQDNQMVAEGLMFLKSDKQFREFMSIITEFAKYGRYYYIDTVVKVDHQGVNPFEKFEDFLDSFYTESDQRTYLEDDELAIIKAIGCIEKGATAIARFFTHGLGEMGKAFYSDFAGYLLLREVNLGKMEYAEKKVPISESYQPMDSRSARFLAIKLISKSSILTAEHYPNWPFKVNKVKVYHTGGINYLVEIDHKVFALTTKTVHDYKVPNYFKSDKLTPKGYATFLLEEAQKLNKNQ
ncbi:MAG: hypothetical protein V4663_02370 [Bacteroidota bacterium]